MKITDVQAHLLAIHLKEVDFPATWVCHENGVRLK